MDYFEYYPTFSIFEVKIEKLWQQTSKNAPLFTSNSV